MVAIEKASEMFNSLGLKKFQAEGLLRLYAEYFDKFSIDCSDHEAEINLNRIDSFHSSKEKFNRRYRGVKSKYVNRYAALFSSWNLKRVRSDRDMLYRTAFNYARYYSEVIRNTELSERNIYTPEDFDLKCHRFSNMQQFVTIANN